MRFSLVAAIRAVSIAFVSFAAFRVAAAPSGGAQPAKTAEDEAFERRIREELAAENKDAIPILDQADEARDKDDQKRAVELYGKVHELAPKYSHALRRKCSAEQRLGLREQAIADCKAALELSESPENLAATGDALLMKPADRDVPSGDIDLAKRDIDRALAAGGSEKWWIQLSSCSLAVKSEDTIRLKRCSEAVLRMRPDLPAAHFLVALHHASEGQFDDAQRALDKAHALGLPDAAYEAYSKSFDEMRPPWSRFGPLALKILALWLAGFALLIVLGFLLSAAALRAARRVPTSPTGHAHGADGLLRTVYRGVLWLSCAYYYISIPIVMALVVIAGGGAIYGFLALGRIPIKLVVIIAIVVFATLWATLKSFFVRRSDSDPGVSLDLEEHPKLRALLAEVAGHLHTRPVETVYMTPGTDLAVMERGGLLKQLRGSSERCLILGAGVLDGMRIRELKGVLAHEYGHFVNEDTAGGGFSFAVRRSLFALAIGLAHGGAATWYNPAWLFVRGFYWVFIRISHGASRLQEVLADRWAAFTYGSEAFERGLLHVIERSVRFSAHAGASIKEAVESKVPLPNLYCFVPSSPVAEHEVKKEVDEEVNRKPSPLDSHPSPQDRILWVRALAAPGLGASIDDQAAAWSLFSDRAALERRMTEEVRNNLLQNQGIAINISVEDPKPSLEAS